jgi:hypothetical protein
MFWPTRRPIDLKLRYSDKLHADVGNLLNRRVRRISGFYRLEGSEANGAAVWYSGLSYVDFRVPGGTVAQTPVLRRHAMHPR